MIDATCPLVTKVHVQARRYAADGYTVLLIGHAGHEEVVGTMGEAPEATILVQDVAEAEALELPGRHARRLHHPDDALGRRDRRDHRRAPPALPARSYAPKKEDICYATSNRQWAVKEMLGEIDLLLVIGSQQLVELEPARRRRARVAASPAHLIDDETEIDEALARRRRDGRHHLGRVGAGAARRAASATGSARAASSEIEPYRMVDEDVTFRLPVELRRELALAESQRA